jgi:hypothetical protein
MERVNCVICTSNSLFLSFSLDKFPQYYLPTLDNIEKDKFIDLDLYGCSKCGCVQLKKLLDTDELYGVSHNNIYHTPTWNYHHIMFCNFIYDINYNTIIEIGGYSGVLARLLKQKNNNIDYTILDICNINPNIENVKFINENCESFEFDENATVIMSHVFEHLYDPTKFINNIKRNKVQTVFVSIPNMNAQIKNNNVPIVNQEHTFLCDYDNIIYLFSKGGYICKSHYYYKDHSIFFKFVYNNIDNNINDITYFDTTKIDRISKIYNNNRYNISNLFIDTCEKVFIVPSAAYGQIIYYFLNNEYKNNIVGFLDNDSNKIGKRLYGTPLYIFKMDEIQNYSKITILIYKGPYTIEIVNQLNSYNTNIRYIYV